MLRWRRAARLCAVGNFPYDLNYSCRHHTAWAFHADKVSLSMLKPLSLYLGVDSPDVIERGGETGWIRSEAQYPTVLLVSSHEGRKCSVKEDRGIFFIC